MLVWHDEACFSPSSDSIATTRIKASANYCKNLSTIQRSDKKLDPFEKLLWSGATGPPLHRVAIPYLLQGKHPPKTPVKI